MDRVKVNGSSFSGWNLVKHIFKTYNKLFIVNQQNLGYSLKSFVKKARKKGNYKPRKKHKEKNRKKEKS